MQQKDMSKEKPMGIAGNLPRARYSAAYPTRAERIAKGSSLPWGLTPLYLGYCHLNVLEGSVK